MSESREHWADHKERGSFRLMQLTAFGIKLLGRRVLSPVLYAIVLYFFLFGTRARRSSWLYQQRLADWSGRNELRPTHWRVFGQYMAFADALLDKLDVWNGRLKIEDIEIVDPALLRNQLRGARGQMLVGAHLGNLEVCRALAELGEQVTMNVLVHTRHAEQFNRLLGEAGASHLRLIQVSELNPAVMLQLSQRLENGEWLAIAGVVEHVGGQRDDGFNQIVLQQIAANLRLTRTALSYPDGWRRARHPRRAGRQRWSRCRRTSSSVACRAPCRRRWVGPQWPMKCRPKRGCW